MRWCDECSGWGEWIELPGRLVVCHVCGGSGVQTVVRQKWEDWLGTNMIDWKAGYLQCLKDLIVDTENLADKTYDNVLERAKSRLAEETAALTRMHDAKRRYPKGSVANP